MFTRDCPCGSASTYDSCCGPLHRGTALATTPEQLMRSRFAAYAVGETDYVFRTWHPRTRPDDLAPEPGLTWTRLEVLDATGDEVEFVAHYDSPAGAGSLHERSVFAQRGGRWVYVGVAPQPGERSVKQ
ncbi:YchJ family protein [Nocardioides allogilvus]|uniref:YchJ family protein n=1 Tax=Nocardioides allogilvus TaxID=2072017 RepID=UPI000D2FD2BB|nr:YchJ family metal-binding protein [Nocardioides allogilvus]